MLLRENKSDGVSWTLSGARLVTVVVDPCWLLKYCTRLLSLSLSLSLSLIDH